MKLIFLFLFYIYSFIAYSDSIIFNKNFPLQVKGIYGEDNRHLISQLPSSESELINLSRSILAQVPKWRVSSENDKFIVVKTKNLEEGLNFCSDEKFSKLPMVSSCSAFLISEDLMLTAGHCFKDKFDCQKSFWVSDYDDDSGFASSDHEVVFSKTQVFSCQQLITWSDNNKLDFALVRLDKKINDRPFFKLRKVGVIKNDSTLAVIGHPLGLPKIVADNAQIRENELPNFFKTNADTYSGNSGSPVIDTQTLLVEGILVRGDEDFKMDLDESCNRSYRCEGLDCKGETVQRSTSLPLSTFPKF